MAKDLTRYISIGNMAKMNNTTVPTLRLYDTMGLLKPFYIDKETNYRYYDIKQNARFDLIQYMKELGMELKEIKEILDKNDINIIEDILHKKKEQTFEELNQLKYKMTAIDRTLNNIERYKKSPKNKTITLEYIRTRNIYSLYVDTNFYDYNIDTYEVILKQLKHNLIEQNIPQVYYCNAGTIMKQDNFENLKFISNEIFIFVDDDFPLKDSIKTISSGMYACIYITDFDEERECASKLLEYCKQNNYKICGNYICEEIMEFDLFNNDKRSMYLRLQVPVVI